MLTIDKTKIFGHIIEQHVNDAAFLWLMRSQAMRQAHHNVTTIGKLEYRINNHLRGLNAGHEYAWVCAAKAAEFQESGEIFILAILAFTSGESSKINRVLELAADGKENLKAVVSALGWLSDDKVNLHIKSWMESKNLTMKYLSIAACSVKRLDPKRYLNALFNDAKNSEDILLFSRMLRLVGELKRHDLAHLLKKAQQHENADIVFWAYWSALLLGDRTALQGLAPYVLQSGPHQASAINLTFRSMDQTQAWAWINTLINTSDCAAQPIAAIAALGDPQGVNWLLARMEEPKYAKAAGEAFSSIVGVDLLQQGLSETQNVTNDDMDAEADNDIPIVDGFENLPKPNVEKVCQYWQQIRYRFNLGQRYFFGQPIEQRHLENIFLNGRQTQRLASALEFALLKPNNAYVNAKATLGQWKKI